MRGKLDVTRWLMPPALPGAAHGDGPRTGVLSSVAVMAVALAVTATAALGAGAGTDTTTRAAGAAPAGRSTADFHQPVGVLIEKGTVPAPTLTGDQGTVGVPPATPAKPTKPVDLAAGRTAAQYAGNAGTMTPAGIATLAMQRGCSSTQAVIATAVAMAESGGSPSAQGDVRLMDGTWDWSAGLWQIRGLKSQRNTGALRDSIANQNAVTNSAAMYAISGGCTNWTPWTTYNTGAYQGYTGVATQAVQYVLAYYKAHHAYPAVSPPDANATVPVPTGGALADGSAPTTRATKSAAPAGKPRAGASRSATAGGSKPGAASTAAGRSTPTPTRTTPHPKPSSSSNPLQQPVGSATSAVGSLASKITTGLPTCLPIIGC